MHIEMETKQLKSIRLGLTNKVDRSEIARKIYLTFPTHAFENDEETQFKLLNEIADFWRIPIYCIHAAGSAKIGFSPHKKQNLSQEYQTLI